MKLKVITSNDLQPLKEKYPYYETTAKLSTGVENQEEIKLFDWNGKLGIANARHTYCIERKKAIIGKGLCKKFAVEYRVNYNQEYLNKFKPGIYLVIRNYYKLKIGKAYGLKIAIGDTRSSVSFDKAMNNLLNDLGYKSPELKYLIYAISKDRDTDKVKVEDIASKYPYFSVWILLPIIIDDETIDSKIMLSQLKNNSIALKSMAEEIIKSTQTGLDRSAIKQFNAVQALKAFSTAGSLTGSSRKDIAISLALTATSYLFPPLGIVNTILNLGQITSQIANVFFGKLEIQAFENQYAVVAVGVKNYNYTLLDKFYLPYSPIETIRKVLPKYSNLSDDEIVNILSRKSGIDINKVKDILIPSGKQKWLSY